LMQSRQFLSEASAAAASFSPPKYSTLVRLLLASTSHVPASSAISVYAMFAPLLMVMPASS
jgi:hypothetical protein